MGLLEQLASGLLNYSRSEPEGLLARGLRQPAGLLGRGLNNAINMPGPGLLAQQDAFFRPSVMVTPEERRAQGAAFLQNIVTGPLGLAPFGWTAYHGSPHKFDKFSLDRIGTGEGAQAYGHGLYFADNADVAKSYVPRSPLQEEKMMAQYKRAEAAQNYPAMEVWEQGLLHSTPEEILKQFTNKEAGYTAEHALAAKQFAQWAKQNPPDKGHLYKVDIDDTRAPKEAFLDWDKPLSQQPEKVRKALSSFEEAVTKDWSVNPTLGRPETAGQVIAGARAMGMKPEEALKSAGIPGIRYLDAGSRTSGGTYNTVLFDDSLVRILERQ